MRVIVFIKATVASETGVMPTEQQLADMAVFNEQLVHAGVILAGEGLHPSNKGKRMHVNHGKWMVADGPFEPLQSIVSGFWIWKVASMEDAVAWVRKCPESMGDSVEIEVRPILEADDFGEAFTPELREQEKRLRATVEKGG